MVHLGTPYDPNQHKETQPRDLLPAGWYAMQIIESEVKPTKDGKNQLLVLTLEVMEATHPQLKGRRVWDYLNLWHTTSADAVDIANSTMKSICKAIGQLQQWDDTAVLHARPMAVKLKLRPAKGEYEVSNGVSDYNSLASRPQLGMGVHASIPAPPAAAPPSGGPQATEPAPVAPPAQLPQGQPGQAAVPPWKQP